MEPLWIEGDILPLQLDNVLEETGDEQNSYDDEDEDEIDYEDEEMEDDDDDGDSDA